jgi:decaprenyl-phosphate phosphoribosyltransferase
MGGADSQNAEAADTRGPRLAAGPARPLPKQPAVWRLQLAGLVAASRPRQWARNVLVAAVPAAAGKLGDPAVVLDTALAFVSFCLASSAIYLVNDVGDREADRNHVTKRHRPIASGALDVRLALAVAAASTVAALLVALLADVALLGAVAGYVVLMTAYTRWLKHEPVFDVTSVAAGFFLRAVAGGLATGLYISQWFLIVAAGASLFVVTGKRYAELMGRGETEMQRPTRRVLSSYPPEYLRSVLSTAAGVTILAYCLWAFEDTGELSAAWSGASVVPFVLALMRYALLVEQGHGEEPEQVFLGDRTLQVLSLGWLVVLGVGALI